MTEQVDPQKLVASWGRQTIAFAISIKAQDGGEPLDDPTQVKYAGTATDKVASELWQQAANECEQQSEFVMRFATKVLDWVADHRVD